MPSFEMPATLPCPFCGADASAKWVMHEKRGKSVLVECSREGECPSPHWEEAADEHESDENCVKSVIGFWNTRAADWSEEGWQSMQGPKPAGVVLGYTIQRAMERKLAEAAGITHYDPYALVRWHKGQWRDPVNSRIYMVRAWKRLSPPRWL